MKPRLETLYAEYAEAIYRFCYWQTNQSHDAEDLVHDIFLEVKKSLPSFTGQGKVRNWLFTIAKRKVLAWIRKKYQLPTTELFENLYAQDDWIDPENEKKKEAFVEEILTSLGTEDRKILQKKYMQGLSAAEIAQDLGLSEANVRVRCHRLIEKIQKRYEV